MCGRFAVTLDLDDLMEAFPDFVFPPDLPPRYNIAPTQPVPVVPNRGLDGASALQGEKHPVVLFRWGLVPFWADDPTIGNRMINARAETVAEKPAFRAAYKYRRCLILSDGFYEWRKEPGRKGKTPYFVKLVSGEPFAFAGLWEVWRPDDSPLFSCTIITTEPNALVAPIHNRMPVILPREAYSVWLDPERQGGRTLQDLLKPYPAEEMSAYEVSTLVNNPRNDVPACVEPVAA